MVGDRKDPKLARDKSDLYTAVTLLVFACVSLIEANNLPFGSMRTPKSGFFSIILAVLLWILSLMLLVQSLRRRTFRAGNVEMISISWKKLCLVTGALVAYGLSFEYLGYVICSFLFILFLLRVIEPQKWWVVFTVASLVSLGSYLVFGVLLKATLPAGILGN